MQTRDGACKHAPYEIAPEARLKPGGDRWVGPLHLLARLRLLHYTIWSKDTFLRKVISMFEIGIFWFITFLYYKILSVFMYDIGLSLIFCIIMATVTSLIVAFTGASFNLRTRLISLKWIESGAKKEEISGMLVSIFAPPILISYSINTVLGYLIAYGFSERFADRHLDYSTSRYSSNADFWLFAVLLAGPPISFFLVQIIGLAKQLKSQS